MHVLVGDESGQLVTYGAQAMEVAETALLDIDGSSIQLPLVFSGREAAPIIVSDANVHSLDLGEPLPVAGRPEGAVRWAYLGILGLACLVPSWALLAFVTLRFSRRAAR